MLSMFNLFNSDVFLNLELNDTNINQEEGDRINAE